MQYEMGGTDITETMDAAAIAAVERTIRSSEALREGLVHSEEAARRMIESMRAGLTLPQAIGEADTTASELRGTPGVPSSPTWRAGATSGWH